MQSYQKRINRFLETSLHQSSSSESLLKQAMAYSLLSGGKRIRPLLVYATAESLDINFDNADYIAASIEMIHAYSLIHDDLPAMDDDDLRRGQPTNHIKFDEATAILAGDALQTLAFETLSKTPVMARQVVKMLQLLAHYSGIRGMAGGQSLDLISENRQLTVEQLKSIHAAKTGALLSACVMLATELITDLQPETKSYYQAYADHLGVAFQIVDDILDVTQDTSTLGKPANSDTKNNKATYPSLLGLESAREAANEHIYQCQKMLNNIPGNTDMLEQLTATIVNRKH